MSNDNASNNQTPGAGEGAAFGPGQVTLREMRIADLNVVCKMESEIFSDCWPRHFFEDMFEEDGWGGLVAELDGYIIGYACYLIVYDEAHLANIAVAPPYRRKSVAKLLLARILQLAREEGCNLMLLEVRASNAAARKFYEQAGFDTLYRRARYYQNPVEDAYVMSLLLT